MIRPIRQYCHALIFIFTVFAAANVSAEGAAEKGLAIAKDMKARDRGWQDSTATLTMTLRNRAGSETTREMRIASLEQIEDGDMSMTIFDNPRDVAGTAFLSHTHINTPDDQWLYLPALKRVKRIASKNKSGPFMGSEFAYEDLSSFEVEKYSYTWLREEPCGKLTCDVIESIPLDEYSGYSRQIIWADQSERRVFKIDFYDKRGTLLKTLSMDGYKQYLDKFWRPANQKMVNHVNGKSTDITMSDYQFATGLSADDFTENSLKRAR